MTLKFKKQRFQDEAVTAVVNCFQGQPLSAGAVYRLDPGVERGTGSGLLPNLEYTGFRNSEISIPQSAILKSVSAIQHQQNLKASEVLKRTSACDFNLDIEMETGTGKTYCYIKTMFELHKQYGWSKFIIVVPSIAIREGVFKSLEITTDHFREAYGKRARFFIYNSKELHNLESFSSDAGINVMVINVQAFNARGQDARRIYEELDDFQSRRPIDVISRNRPIMILDEPQKMEGAKTLEAFKEFTPLIMLRYSATHKQEHNKVYRLDALDAYNQKLVKKIAVRGISVKGLAGSNAYLYLQSIQISANKPPEAHLEIEIQQKTGIKRVTRKVGKNDNLHDLSDGLEQYRGFVVTDINAIDNTLSFTNGVILQTGEATGDVSESELRRIQIREAIAAHFQKEQELFPHGLKVLTLFFIDEVAKYRFYDDAGEQPGEYARMFEEEYNLQLNDVLTLENSPYHQYLKGIQTPCTHNGYFSVDKRSKRLVNPNTGARSTEADDVDAYDLILKDKERLLSFDEPVRFIFSHSALREGWDNPNVFVICTLKHSDNTISRRQEVGRGMRLAVNQNGDRMDDPATVHQINVLTVIASESYKDFVTGLQRDISASLSERPRKADEAYFAGKVLKTDFGGEEKVTPSMAKAIYKYLLKNDYIDDSDGIAPAYHEAVSLGTLAPLPPDLVKWAPQITRLIHAVFSEDQLPEIGNDRKIQINPTNENFHKREFQELWSRISRKAAYTVEFDSNELIVKCVATLDRDLKVTPLQYTVQRGEQTDTASYEAIKKNEGFSIQQTETSQFQTSVHSQVKYDLIGKVAGETRLTRATIGAILQQIRPTVFAQYRTNPEDFLRKAAQLINEQKATVIVEHLAYSPVDDAYSIDIFTAKQDLSKGVKKTRSVCDYVFTDSAVERKFVDELDTDTKIEVYAKLPKAFAIPTPVGDYNPDWAIAFKQGTVKHIYFIAETKGSMSSLELREIEKSKIGCARRFFAKITSDQVKYDVVDSYAKLMELVK